WRNALDCLGQRRVRALEFPKFALGIQAIDIEGKKPGALAGRNTNVEFRVKPPPSFDGNTLTSRQFAPQASWPFVSRQHGKNLPATSRQCESGVDNDILRK